MKDRKDIYWRAYLVYFTFVILLLVVFIKTVSIQFVEKQTEFTTSNQEERMPTRIVKKAPRRGQILDANYKPLVTSVSFYDIHMDPTVVKKDTFDKYVEDLAISLNELWPEKTAAYYKKKIASGRARGSKYVLIHRKATNEERKKLREMPIFNKGRLKGGLIDNEETILRKRPHGELLKRTLGYVKVIDSANTKRVGLEGAFNEFLQGEYGEQIEQKISTGWKKIGPVTKEAVEGADIVTSIDKEIQEVAHSELLNQLKNQGAKNGCAIVMDVKTGFVKAIVNLVKNQDGNYYEAYNHAIGTKEVPGSTFKLASLMALLEDGKVNLTDKVNAKGSYYFYGERMDDSNNGYGYGEISIQEAFEKSSNVLAEVVNNSYKNDQQAFVDKLKSFGLADSLGIDIDGEKKPTLYEPGTPNWSGISLPWMSIGYEVQQTPLQTLAFYNAVANKGTFMKPQFVQQVVRGGQIVEEFEPITINEQICSESTLNQIHNCLVGVVERGTGTTLKSAYFDIAGKTGTAVVLNDNRSYGSEGKKKYQASFAGYFPAAEPVYSCIVVVSAPKDIYGATVSGTVFTAIANKVYASSLQYHKPINRSGAGEKSLPRTKIAFRNDVEHLLEAYKIPFQSLTQSPLVASSNGGNEILLEKRNIPKNVVPNVVGLTARDAVYLIELAGLRPRIAGSGIVKKQSIQAGKPIENGRIMRIELQ